VVIVISGSRYWPGELEGEEGSGQTDDAHRTADVGKNSQSQLMAIRHLKYDDQRSESRLFFLSLKTAYVTQVPIHDDLSSTIESTRLNRGIARSKYVGQDRHGER